MGGPEIGEATLQEALDAVFDADYKYFYETFLTDEVNETTAALIWDLAKLEPGRRVLDAGCGYGRMANRLAAMGAAVTGLDSSAELVRLAKQDAATRGVDVEYLTADMRGLPQDRAYDVVLSWSGSIGYMDDAMTAEVLRRFHDALGAHGLLLLQVMFRDCAAIQPEYQVIERGDDFCIDHQIFDPITAMLMIERTIIRDGAVRRAALRIRAYTPAEIDAWLKAAGFKPVQIFGMQRQPLTKNSLWLTVLAART